MPCDSGMEIEVMIIITIDIYRMNKLKNEIKLITKDIEF